MIIHHINLHNNRIESEYLMKKSIFLYLQFNKFILTLKLSNYFILKEYLL